MLSSSILKLQKLSSSLPSPIILTRRNLSISATNFRMDKNTTTQQHNQSPDKSNNIQSNPRVNQLQKVIHSSSSSDAWEKSWEQRITPWDLGQATPIVLHLLQTGALPKGRALVPGCGTGYDVVAMACPERYVVGLDISDIAIKQALKAAWKQRFRFYGKEIQILEEDFFTWSPPELFDLVFDYTFFCAIDPGLRPAWAQKIPEILKPDGELITLMFPISDHFCGPPYKVSVSDYEEVLHPLGFKAISIVDNEMAIGPRKGKEKLGKWKRFPTHSPL